MTVDQLRNERDELSVQLGATRLELEREALRRAESEKAANDAALDLEAQKLAGQVQQELAVAKAEEEATLFRAQLHDALQEERALHSP